MESVFQNYDKRDVCQIFVSYWQQSTLQRIGSYMQHFWALKKHALMVYWSVLQEVLKIYSDGGQLLVEVETFYKEVSCLYKDKRRTV